MASIIPAKGVLSHGEESYDDMVLRRRYEGMRLEKKHWEDEDTARAAAEAARAPCVWKSYESCRNCGLYGECFKLEAQHGET